MPVTVAKKGSYSILAEVLLGDGTETGNGYSFFTSGEFTGTGNTTVTLFGQGSPLEAFDDIAYEDIIKIAVNGKEIACQAGASLPTIRVEDIVPEYTFSCSSVFSTTDLKIGTPVAESDVVTLRLSSNKPGGRYIIETDEINGIKFSGSGFLVGGTQVVTLYAEGTPLRGGTYTYSILANSANSMATCTVDVNVMYPPMKVHVYGPSSGDWGMYVANRSALLMMCKNSSLFGLGENPDAPCNVESIDVTGQSTTSATLNNMNNYDVIFVGYPLVPSSAMANDLAQYVMNKRGTLVACADSGYESFIVTIMNKITPGHGMRLSGGSEGPNLMEFVSGNPAVNGAYMNLAGKSFGRDGAGNFSFQNVHEDWIVLNGTRASARVIMHKEYRVFLCGDGGIWTGGTPGWYEGAGFHAARVDANGNPITATQAPFNGRAYNSAFLANVLMWGFEFAGSASATPNP